MTSIVTVYPFNYILPCLLKNPFISLADSVCISNAQFVVKDVISNFCFLFSVLPPFLMDALERRGVLRRYPWISAPLQVVLCGLL